MAMTMTQKILAAGAGVDSVRAGDLITCNLDVVLGNDITSPVAIKEFEKMGAKEVFDREKVVIVPDHFTPNKDIKAAEQCKFVREFAISKGIKNYFEVGEVVLNTACCLKKGWLSQATFVSAQIHTPAPMVLWAPFLPVLEALIWQREWRPGRFGSKYRRL